MFLLLSEISGEPLQSQIVRQIRAKALSGELNTGYCLPSIRAFAREQRVSVITVQRAYEALEHEGLIYSAPAKGFYISDLDNVKRKEIASENLKISLQPALHEAHDSGLNNDEIEKIVKEIIDKK